VLDYTAGMTRTPSDVSPETFEALRKALPERQLIELTAAIAQENFRARFNRPFDVQPESVGEGAYCPLPER
jgi:alkylhydroperoxidase family enzyme